MSKRTPLKNLSSRKTSLCNFFKFMNFFCMLIFSYIRGGFCNVPGQANTKTLVMYLYETDRQTDKLAGGDLSRQAVVLV